MRKGNGFTLIELLTVISIIVLLVAILLPTFQRVKKQAKVVVCQSNLKQWGYIFAMYMNNNDGLCPRQKFHSLANPEPWMYIIHDYSTDNEGIYCCPAATKIASPEAQEGTNIMGFRPTSGPGATVGGTFLAWGKLTFNIDGNQTPAYYGSYGMNNWLSMPQEGGVVIIGCGLGMEQYKKSFWRTSNVKGAGNIPVFLDSWWWCSWVKDIDRPPEYDCQKTDFPRGYDSTKPQSPDDNMARMYSAMMGESFIARVTPQGKIAGLELDKMYLGMADKMMESEDKMIKDRTKGRAQEAIERLNKRYGSREKRKQALKQQIEQFPVFSEERIRSIAISTIAVLPSSPIQIGDSWKDKITVDLLALIEIDSTHTLKGHENGTVSIDVRAKRSLKDKPIVTKIGPNKSSTRLAGSYEATIKVDEKSGWLISKRADMHFTGETTLAGNKQAPQRQKMQMSAKATVTVEPMKSVSNN